MFVIPGPEAIAGIERADEPIAELLARFEAVAISRSVSRLEERVRLAAPGPAPAPLADLVRGDGPVAALCAAQCVVSDDGRTHPNPLWRLVAPGDTISERDGTVVIRPSSATAERVTLERDGNDAIVTVDTAATAPLVLRFRPLPGGAEASAGRRRRPPRRRPAGPRPSSARVALRRVGVAFRRIAIRRVAGYSVARRRVPSRGPRDRRRRLACSLRRDRSHGRAPARRR